MTEITKENKTRYTVYSPIKCDCGELLYFDEFKEYDDDASIMCEKCKTEWLLRV